MCCGSFEDFSRIFAGFFEDFCRIFAGFYEDTGGVTMVLPKILFWIFQKKIGARTAKPSKNLRNQRLLGSQKTVDIQSIFQLLK